MTIYLIPQANPMPYIKTACDGAYDGDRVQVTTPSQKAAAETYLKNHHPKKRVVVEVVEVQKMK